MADADWTDAENDMIVADYFVMLQCDLSGAACAKTEHRRALMPLLSGRSEGSIEFKHQNISVVLLGLGQPWIDGYKPASRFQGSLVDAVVRWLDARPDWLLPTMTGARVPQSTRPGFAEDRAPLWIGPAPTFANEPPPIDPAMTAMIARKCDVADRKSVV